MSEQGGSTPTAEFAAVNADGHLCSYRQAGAILEVIERPSSLWRPVTGEDMLRMTPTQLRVVADCISGQRTRIVPAREVDDE